MFDIGWAEMLVLSVVALLVLGPRELPTLLRMGGRLSARARRFTREMRDAMDIDFDDAPNASHGADIDNLPAKDDDNVSDLFVAPDTKRTKKKK